MNDDEQQIADKVFSSLEGIARACDDPALEDLVMGYAKECSGNIRRISENDEWAEFSEWR